MRKGIGMRTFLVLLMLSVLLVAGCATGRQDSTKPPPPIDPSDSATIQADSGLWPTVMPEIVETAQPVAPATPSGLPAPYCRPSEAFVELSVPTGEWAVGQIFTVTVTLANGDESNVHLGLIQYSLSAQPDMLVSGNLEAVQHPTSIGPGDRDQAHFVLRAIAPGKLVLTASASYEIHALDYTSASWSGCESQPLEITIEVTEYTLADLMTDLRALDLTLEVTQETVDHGFAIQGERILVDGNPVFVYEFADATAADIAIAGVSADRYSVTVIHSEGELTVGTHSDWIESPHLYRRGQLIAIVGDDPDTLAALNTVMGSPAWSPGPRDCSLANALPPEEAELVWPTLRQVQPDPAAPGQQVEIRGTGGFLYWNNECGEFRNESARDFELLVDGERAGIITCYAHTCLANLTIAADATPGIHTIAVEGGSSISMEVAGGPPPSQASGMQDLELVGFLGSAQARAVAVQGDHAYVGIDIELAIVDVSNSYQPRRVGHLFFPGPVMDIALVRGTEQDHTYAYVVVGNGAGLYVVEITDPTKPAVLGTYYAGSYVSEVLVAGGYAYVSGNLLRILDVANPARPVNVATHSLTQSTSGERVAAVAIGDSQDRRYLYMIYNQPQVYGLQIVEATDPAAPVALGSLTMNGPINRVTIVGQYAYLLVGPGLGRLVIVDVSDPLNPGQVNSVLAESWASESLARQDSTLYLAGYDPREYEPTGGLQALDIADPANPVVLGRYTGLRPSLLDTSVEGEWAYVAAGDGLTVLDISDPALPTSTGTYRANALAGQGHDLAVAGKFAYVAAGEAGLRVVDISDPLTPRVVGSHDTVGHAWAVELIEDNLPGRIFAYLADEYNGLRVIDVSNPLAPVEIGAYDLPGQYEFFHGLAINPDDPQYAYVADGGLMDTGLRVVDISDPTQPFEIAFLALTGEDEGVPPPRVEDVVVADGYAYLAAGTAGLGLIDISNPAAPAEIGFYDTPGRVDNLVVVGSYAYLADGDLRIIDISDPGTPLEVGFYDVPALAGTPHVAVQGQHAYLTGDGIQILNVSDPGSLLPVARHPVPMGDVAAVGDMVYVIGNGLFILQFSPLGN